MHFLDFISGKVQPGASLGSRSRSILSRMALKTVRGTATSAIWARQAALMARSCLTTSIAWVALSASAHTHSRAFPACSGSLGWAIVTPDNLAL
jgi:hypothetical protein